MKRDNGIIINRKIMWIATGAAICTCIVLFLLDFSARVDDEVENMAVSHLEDVGIQSAQLMKTIMDSAVKEVEDTAFYLSELQDKSAEDVSILLTQIQEREEFSTVRLVAEDGSIYDSEGKLMKTSELSSEAGRHYVSELLSGNRGVSDVFVSALTGDKIFAVYAPVKKGEHISGGIFGVVVLGNLVDTVSTTGFSGRSYNYIVSSEGELIIQSGHGDRLCTGPNFFRFLDNETDDKTMDSNSFKVHIEKQESGFFRYSVGTQERLAYFLPSGINNWYVITAVTVEAVKEYKDEINLTALYLILKIAVVFVIVAFLIVWWFGKTRGIVLKSKAELELEKKKLELSLKQTANRIFEYRREKDEFSFLAGSGMEGQGIPKTISDFSKAADNQGIVDRQYFPQLCQMIVQAGNGEACLPAEMKAGSWFPKGSWFRISLSVIENEGGHILDVIGTMEDISLEKQDKKRYEQEEQYRRALLSETVAIWSVDLRKQSILTCSVAGEEMPAEEGDFGCCGEFLNRVGVSVYSGDQVKLERFFQISQLLAAFYEGIRDLKDVFRISYPGIEGYHWVSCKISLLSEPSTGNPMAFIYVRDVDEERRREMELTYSSERDPLTGLYNRRNISERIEAILNQEGHSSCLMMMDLDGFKGINDRYGHQEGDRALKAIAAVLAKAFRSGDLVARMGGDEFVAFLNHLPDRACAYDRAEMIRSQVESLVIHEGLPRISVSIGLAYAPEDGQNFMLLYKHADEALYEAKREGRNTVVTYSGE